MSNQYLDIEAFARLSGLSVNTVRRKIKTLSETDKKAYIQYVPIVGRGGQKTMLDKALINHWVINGDAMSNQQTEQKDNGYSMDNQQKDDVQEQINEPEYDKIKNESSQSIIEILRGQIQFVQYTPQYSSPFHGSQNRFSSSFTRH